MIDFRRMEKGLPKEPFLVVDDFRIRNRKLLVR